MFASRLLEYGPSAVEEALRPRLKVGGKKAEG